MDAPAMALLALTASADLSVARSAVPPHAPAGMSEMMQGMTQMMQGTAQRRPAAATMMPGGMTEDRIARLSTELGITAAQLPQWTSFAEALRARTQAMQGMRAQMMSGPAAGESWPDRLAQHERHLSAHLAAMKTMEIPVKALWDVLSEEQRQHAAAMLPGPIGLR